MKALVLAGGLGTRLRPLLADRPKALAEVNGEPFLALLLRHLARRGVTHAVLCLGHRAQLIRQVIERGPSCGLELSYAVEEQPLGTGGAVRHAAPHLRDVDDFLLYNGDTFVDVDPAALVARRRQSAALGVLALQRTASTAGRGLVRIDAHGRLLSFDEKPDETASAGGVINAGVYAFGTALLDHIPAGRAVSLERDTLPALLALGQRLEGQVVSGVFIDIGTPADYQRAAQLLAPYAAPVDD